MNQVAAPIVYTIHNLQAIYTPTDNVLASAMANLAQITDAAKIPVFAADEGMNTQTANKDQKGLLLWCLPLNLTSKSPLLFHIFTKCIRNCDT